MDCGKDVEAEPASGMVPLFSVKRGWKIPARAMEVLMGKLNDSMMYNNYIYIYGGFKHEFYFPQYMGCHPSR